MKWEREGERVYIEVEKGGGGGGGGGERDSVGRDIGKVKGEREGDRVKK